VAFANKLYGLSFNPHFQGQFSATKGLLDEALNANIRVEHNILDARGLAKAMIKLKA
jgi:hypothetical protein